MNDLPAVYVILLNYCNYSLTMDCVESIKKSTYSNVEIIVVDNKSPNGDYELLKNASKGRFVLLDAGCNNGFSAGNNVGIRYAMEQGAEYVLLLNNDTIIDAEMIEKLVQHADANTVAVPKIYYYDNPNTIWYAGGSIDYKKVDSRHHGIHMQEGINEKTDACDLITGCCALISSQIIKRVGFLSEEFFMYFEDLDYSIRLKNEGIGIVYCPEAKMWHKVGSTAGTVSKLATYYQTRNRLIIAKKYSFTLSARIYVKIWALGLALRGVIKNSNDKIRFKAFVDYLSGGTGKANI